jgi:hypothetical protein
VIFFHPLQTSLKFKMLLSKVIFPAFMPGLKRLINADPFSLMTAFYSQKDLGGKMQIFHFVERDPPPPLENPAPLILLGKKRSVYDREWLMTCTHY